MNNITPYSKSKIEYLRILNYLSVIISHMNCEYNKCIRGEIEIKEDNVISIIEKIVKGMNDIHKKEND